MLVTLATLPSLGSVACQAGELDDRQERYLRKQLDKHYPNTGVPAGDETSANSNDESNTQTPPAETTGAADTSEAPAATSEADATPTVTSEAASSLGSSADTGGSQIPDCAIQTFQSACAGNACHYQGVINLPPNFETDEDLFTMLTTATASCSSAPSQRYIDLANPQNSYLMVKVRGEQPSGCGTAMPPSGSTITQAQIDCLEAWIDSL